MVQFKDIKNKKRIYLYCGDLPIQRRQYTSLDFIGLSMNTETSYQILHDITNPFDLYDNSVDIVQSEDVMEHIEYSKIPQIIDEIYRILKPNGLFRLSVPDYNCDILANRVVRGKNNEIIFDSGGGGYYDSISKRVLGGGHVWFPNITLMYNLLEMTKFKCIYKHYYDVYGKPVLHDIDYRYGFIARTPDNDNRVKNPRRPLSIVIDCYKNIN